MPWNASDIPSQSGKTAIVTGGNSGIGLIAARELARHGAAVTIACRDTGKGDAAVEKIRADLGAAGTGAEVFVGKLDLASLDSVREFAEAFLPVLSDALFNELTTESQSKREVTSLPGLTLK